MEIVTIYNERTFVYNYFNDNNVYTYIMYIDTCMYTYKLCEAFFMERVIFHIDVNSAFLSWEAQYRLKHLNGKIDIRNIPSAVGGDISKRHGIILAKSVPAKKYNIKTGEPIVQALRKCPNLLIVPPNFSVYEKNSKAFMNILKQYSPIVQQYSIDEAFMDMTGTEKLFGKPLVAAHNLKDRIKNELGFTVNIGISSNKLLAKMASDFKKPDMVHTLFKSEIKDKMWNLPIGDLFFVGKATEMKLKKIGINTIGELAELDIEVVKSYLKKQGETIWKFANGIDTSIVETIPSKNKGYGNSTTTSFDVLTINDAKLVFLSLAENVSRRLRKDNCCAKLVSVGMRDCNLNFYSHQCVLKNPVNTTSEIYKVACDLFREKWDGTPLRQLGISTGKIIYESDGIQINLFQDEKSKKQQLLDSALDEIRNKYGSDSIKRASFIKNHKVDHMEGGISKENLKVDYSKERIL